LIHHFSASGVVGGGMGTVLGLIVGSILLTPIFEYVVHDAGTDVTEEILAKIGVGKGFLEELASAMMPGSSALFVLVLKADPEQVLKELKPFKGKVFRTSLIKDKSAIKAILESAR
jgi:uncharacterized membrane protein